MNRLLPLVFLMLVSFSACGKNAGSNAGPASTLDAANTAVGAAAEQEVTFTTADGVVISGTMYTAGSGAKPTVLCLHQWRDDRASYGKFARALTAAGFNVLAIDMRGYGKSTSTKDGASIRPDREAVRDVEAAVTFLRANPAVDKSRIAIVGASYGASNALIYAAKDKGIRALVLLSPGLNYFHVLPTEDAARAYGSRPMYAIASSEDVRSVEAVEKYGELGGAVRVQLYDNAGHGTEMLQAHADLTPAIIDFLRASI